MRRVMEGLSPPGPGVVKSAWNSSGNEAEPGKPGRHPVIMAVAERPISPRASGRRVRKPTWGLRGLSVVAVQDSADSLATPDRSIGRRWLIRCDDRACKSLMVALPMVVFDTGIVLDAELVNEIGARVGGCAAGR